METAEERGEPEVVDMFKTVRLKGEALTRAIEELLPPYKDLNEQDVDLLRERFGQVLSSMLEAEVWSMLAKAPDYAPDLHRVRSAAARLQAFSQRAALGQVASSQA